MAEQSAVPSGAGGRLDDTLDGLRRWVIRAVTAVIVVVVLWRAFNAVVGVVTSHLWFESVGQGSVYSTMLRAQILLFAVFAVLGGLAGWFTIRTVRRAGPRLHVEQQVHSIRWWFRKHEPRLWPIVLLLGVVIPAWIVGGHAARQWQTYLLWRHASSWHATDPQFHKDLSFFIEVNPFHVLVVALLSQIVVITLWIAVIAGFLYGIWRFRGPGPRITRSITKLVSLLLAAWFVLKAVNYWIGRYAVDTSQRGPVTGPSYTDVHAVLPGKVVLMAVALACAGLLLANVVHIGRLRVTAAAVVVLLIASAVFGSAWTSLVYRFREQPSAATVDLGEIAHNLQATRTAFGLRDVVSTVPYKAARTLHGKALQHKASHTAQIPLIDPNRLSPTFNVKQQLQSYYQFKSTLDIDHYDLDGRSQDVALAVRELQVGGIPHSSWVNSHLVYTHGYGIVAAPTGRMNPKTEGPDFLNAGMPPAQQIPVNQPAIYFGQSSPNYSIVGAPPGSRQKLEFDHPGNNGSSRSAHTTYAGHGGIPIGSTMRRLLFALQLNSPNILFSSDINKSSQLLMVRNPRARVAKVAPWLTLDGDVYPAVVDGHIDWVVDGYTSTNNYPGSQLVNLHKATSSTLSTNGATVAQPSTQVNYLRNSVKATVDAYTGKVTLYNWQQNQLPDPLLKTWESIFPGLVQPQSSIPAALMPHLRYPQDLFNVQRSLLAQYHVTSAPDFYSGNDFWKVPTDPTVSANQQFNAGSSGSTSSGPNEPSAYITMSPDGFAPQRYTLSSPMVTLNRRDLAAFISVDAQPGPDYGKFTILDFPSSSGGESPSQVQNDIESDTKISEALTLQRGGNSKVVLGDLEAIPVAGRMLYVEPVYTQAAASNSFPILRHVIALYANGDPAFDDGLAPALRQAIASGDVS
ncbi:UPF0182 family protein [Nocardioides terrisoli]|uniref:UPF0182 family protein n=1 Tax=Nocardioides terrisoli TaxID=3388267 RepID=UPI00287B9E25|nr:UPF0182 family protein [Nocardioides marmorisolisilvae]